jgi:hypothetical protein
LTFEPVTALVRMSLLFTPLFLICLLPTLFFGIVNA